MLFATAAIGSIVLLVAAFIAAGKANSADHFDTYAYVAGLGAVPWLVASIAALWAAAWRANVIRDDLP